MKGYNYKMAEINEFNPEKVEYYKDRNYRNAKL